MRKGSPSRAAICFLGVPSFYHWTRRFHYAKTTLFTHTMTVLLDGDTNCKRASVLMRIWEAKCAFQNWQPASVFPSQLPMKLTKSLHILFHSKIIQIAACHSYALLSICASFVAAYLIRSAMRCICTSLSPTIYPTSCVSNGPFMQGVSHV